MKEPRSTTETIIGALNVLARDIQTDDGVINGCLYEAASRLEELRQENERLREMLKPFVKALDMANELNLQNQDYIVIARSKIDYSDLVYAKEALTPHIDGE